MLLDECKEECVHIAYLREIFESKFDANSKALLLASEAIDKRLQSMNEIRDQLKDQAGTFLTRAEFNLMHQRVLDDIRMLRESRAEIVGKADQGQLNITFVITIMGLLIGIADSTFLIIHALK
jgi:hypothetical protein